MTEDWNRERPAPGRKISHGAWASTVLTLKISTPLSDLILDLFGDAKNVVPHSTGDALYDRTIVYVRGRLQYRIATCTNHCIIGTLNATSTLTGRSTSSTRREAGAAVAGTLYC
jgi:hypothetical protein